MLADATVKVKDQPLLDAARQSCYSATVDGIYLRTVIHANEHMGQLIAYARKSGVVPPWSTQ